MNLNKLMIFALTLMIGCIIVGCGGSPSESDLIGKWESDLNITKQALKDEGLEGELTKHILSTVSMTFEFKEDGTLVERAYTANQGPKNFLGEMLVEWKLDGSTLKTLLEGKEEWDQSEISLSGDELVIKDGEESIGLKRVK